METISVIIPTFNMRRQLRRCLDALSKQTVLPNEVIVVDDGSTDGTADTVGARLIAPVHGDQKLAITFVRQDHAGAAAARNRGFAESKGDYVMWLDADVVLKKHAIERLHTALLTSLRGGDSRQSNPQGIATVASLPRDDIIEAGYAYSAFRWGWKKFTSFPFDAERLRQMPYIHTTSLIRREALPEKPFDENLKRLQDWNLYLTLLEAGYGGAFVPEVLFTVETRGTMSRWLPSVMYRIPFERFGIGIKALDKYREAERLVRVKHHLENQKSKIKNQNEGISSRRVGTP